MLEVALTVTREHIFNKKTYIYFHVNCEWYENEIKVPNLFVYCFYSGIFRLGGLESVVGLSGLT